MGRNLEDPGNRSSIGRENKIRPKSEKCRTVASAKTTERTSTNLIQKNLDEIFSLSNSELKKKLESCPGNLGDCPLINDFRKGLKKTISSHVNLTSTNDDRVCKTSRVQSKIKDRNPAVEKESVKMLKQKAGEISEKKRNLKDVKSVNSNTSKGVIRSTRAQDLRSQSNRDLLKPKTTGEKPRTMSPYVTNLPQKKKKCCSIGNPETKSLNRSNLMKISEEKKKNAKTLNKNDKNSRLPCCGKMKKEKPSSAGEALSLQRQKTQDIINPKIIKKTASSQPDGKTAAGDCGPLVLKKSPTFFICKGTKNGDSLRKQTDLKPDWESKKGSLSDGNGSEEEIASPKPKPLTHNDSFCLIVKSSQNWSQKNRSDDEKWLQYGMSSEEKKVTKTNDKGILKNADYNLKSVDSLEKIDSEKIVRFSDELVSNKKVLKKCVRRKKRIPNFFTPTWYQKNKLFQKYLQILKEKSVLLSEKGDNTPENLKPFQVPIHVKERYEAEMFGLYRRKEKLVKSHSKDSYIY